MLTKVESTVHKQLTETFKSIDLQVSVDSQSFDIDLRFTQTQNFSLGEITQINLWLAQELNNSNSQDHLRLKKQECYWRKSSTFQVGIRFKSQTFTGCEYATTWLAEQPNPVQGILISIEKTSSGFDGDRQCFNLFSALITKLLTYHLVSDDQAKQWRAQCYKLIKWDNINLVQITAERTAKLYATGQIKLADLQNKLCNLELQSAVAQSVLPDYRTNGAKT